MIDQPRKLISYDEVSLLTEVRYSWMMAVDRRYLIWAVLLAVGAQYRNEAEDYCYAFCLIGFPSFEHNCSVAGVAYPTDGGHVSYLNRLGDHSYQMYSVESPWLK